MVDGYARSARRVGSRRKAPQEARRGSLSEGSEQRRIEKRGERSNAITLELEHVDRPRGILLVKEKREAPVRLRGHETKATSGIRREDHAGDRDADRLRPFDPFGEGW